MCLVVVTCHQDRHRGWVFLSSADVCLVLQLTGVDYFGQAGGMSVEQLLMELRESREEVARLREEIDSTKVS